MELSTYAGDFRAFKGLIAAQVAGVAVTVKEVDPKGTTPNTVPVLSTPHGELTQSNAIARYIARSRPEAGLFGQSFFQSGQVDSFIDWGTNNVELPAIVSTYWQFGWQEFNFQANKKALEDLAAAFATLEAHLLSRTYLVGNRLSLADIIIASQLFYPLKLTLDGAFRAQFPATIRWFSHVTALPAAAAVLGAVVLCRKAPAAPKKAEKPKGEKPAAKEGGGGKKPQGEQKPKGEKPAKQEKPKPAPKAAEPAEEADADADAGGEAAPGRDLEAEAEAEEAARKKKGHPLDKLPPSTLQLDEWKRQYSNSGDDYFKSMDWFWPNFDASGYSLWLQEFQHNEECVQDFIVSNKIEGYIQRTSEIQKYAFGVLQILDSKAEKGHYTVNGVWLIRGPDISPMLDCNPEAVVYTWTKLDHTDEATRKRIANYWCGETGIDGLDSVDAKVFK